MTRFLDVYGQPTLPISHRADNTGTDDVFDYIDGAIAEMASNGGGTVYLPPGRYKTSQTITPPAKVTLMGGGSGAYVAANTLKTRATPVTALVWGGAPVGDVVKFYTPEETPAADRRHGGGLRNLMIDGNDLLAGTGLRVEAWLGAHFFEINVWGCSVQQVILIPSTYTVNGGNGAPQRNIFRDCIFHMQGNGSIYTTSEALGVRLAGRASRAANTNLNTFESCYIFTQRGIPWKIENADDNYLRQIGGLSLAQPQAPGQDALHIAGITNANPAVVTYGVSDNHPSNDWKGFTSSVYGMWEINDRVVTIKNVNTGTRTFELYDEAGTTPIDSTSFGVFVNDPVAINDVAIGTQATVMPIVPGIEFGSSDQDSVESAFPARHNVVEDTGALIRGRASQTGGGSSSNFVFWDSRANNNPAPQEEAGAGGAAKAAVNYFDSDGNGSIARLVAREGIRGMDGFPLMSPRLIATGGRAPGLDGTDTQPATTELYLAEILVPFNTITRGVTILTGSAVLGTCKAAIIDGRGVRLRQTNTAGTALTAVNTVQLIPWSGTPLIEIKGPGPYYLAVMFGNTGARFRTHPVGGFVAGKITGLDYATGIPATITLPTTFTASTGPMMSLY